VALTSKRSLPPVDRARRPSAAPRTASTPRSPGPDRRNLIVSAVISARWRSQGGLRGSRTACRELRISELRFLASCRSTSLPGRPGVNRVSTNSGNHSRPPTLRRHQRTTRRDPGRVGRRDAFAPRRPVHAHRINHLAPGTAPVAVHQDLLSRRSREAYPPIDFPSRTAGRGEARHYDEEAADTTDGIRRAMGNPVTEVGNYAIADIASFARRARPLPIFGPVKSRAPTQTRLRRHRDQFL
jgi:hypothetical protein